MGLLYNGKGGRNGGRYLLSCNSGEKTARNLEIFSKDSILNDSGDCLPLDDDDDFFLLMRRIREGSEDAAWELFEKYGGYIRRAVRRALNPRLRTQFESQDFVQMVWKSFFRMHQ